MNSSQLAMNRFEVELFTPQPTTRLSFSLSLETSGEKSLSPEIRAKMSMWCLGVAEVQGVDHHVDVGAVLAAGLALGDIDQLDPMGVELADGVAVVAPVAIRPLEDDPAFLQEPLQHQRDLERLAAASCRGRRRRGSRNRQRRQSTVRRTWRSLQQAPPFSHDDPPYPVPRPKPMPAATSGCKKAGVSPPASEICGSERNWVNCALSRFLVGRAFLPVCSASRARMPVLPLPASCRQFSQSPGTKESRQSPPGAPQRNPDLIPSSPVRQFVQPDGGRERHFSGKCRISPGLVWDGPSDPAGSLKSPDIFPRGGWTRGGRSHIMGDSFAAASRGARSGILSKSASLVPDLTKEVSVMRRLMAILILIVVVAVVSGFADTAQAWRGWGCGYGGCGWGGCGYSGCSTCGYWGGCKHLRLCRLRLRVQHLRLCVLLRPGLLHGQLRPGLLHGQLRADLLYGRLRAGLRLQQLRLLTLSTAGRLVPQRRAGPRTPCEAWLPSPALLRILPVQTRRGNLAGGAVRFSTWPRMEHG